MDGKTTAFRLRKSIMLLKLFRKPTDVRPRFQQDSTLAAALARRVMEIDFQPSKGFLKDQWQEKRPPASDLDSNLNSRLGDAPRRRAVSQARY